MNNSNNNNNNMINKEEYIEIDLREYIMTLWNNKWLIIALVVVSVLAAGLYSKYITEPKYKANATLLIYPSTYKTELEVGTLPIETYRNLAMTDSIKSKIIEDVNIKNSNGELYSPSDLDNMLSLKVHTYSQQQNNNNNFEAPVMKLNVVNPDPKLASKIANSWSKHFMQDCKDLRQNEVLEITNVIQQQFDDTKQKLTKAKKNLKNYKEEVRLEILKSELNAKQKKLDEVNNNIVNLKDKLGSTKSEKEHLVNVIDSKETDGHWINDINGNGINGNSKQTTNVSDVKIRKNYINAQDELIAYLDDHNLELLKQRIKLKENNLQKYRKKLSSLKTTLKEKNIENEQIVKLINQEPKKWTLKRSVTTNSLWENILNSQRIDAIKNLKLDDEIINPIYKDLKNNKTKNVIVIRSYNEQINYYENKIETVMSDLEEMHIKRESWQKHINRLNTDIEHYKKIFNDYARNYRELKFKLEVTNQNIKSIDKQLSFYTNKKNVITEDIKSLQSKIWTAENKKEELVQNVEDLQNTYDKLSSKVEEARLTKAEKTGDVKFVAEAIVPTKPININTKLNIAIAAVLALFLGVFLVFFKEFLKEHDNK